MKRLVRLVKEGALLQGGAFRLDKGPTSTELNSFRYAVALYGECRVEGKTVTLGCIWNDLGLSPDKRPKRTGLLEWPSDYLALLQKAHIPLPKIDVQFESTLRNRARQDLSQGRISCQIGFTPNETTGVLVATCPALMGRYYANLAKAGFSQEVGFYTREPKCDDDHSCSTGPVLGTQENLSGYALRIPVLNFWVYPDGHLSHPMPFR